MTLSKVLIIEDDEVFAASLMRRLTKHDFSCEHVEDCSEALLKARSLTPDVILLDMYLDGDSGLRIVEPLRNILPKAKIILLTGFASIATAVEAIKLGADDYLAKPVDSQTLLTVITGNKPKDSIEAEPDTMSQEQMEWEHIQQVLKLNDGNVSAAARQLSMHRRTLQRKLKKKPNFPTISN